LFFLSKYTVSFLRLQVFILKRKTMAKKEGKASGSLKITFGKKSGKGKIKKKYGPKEQKPKAYRGQGR
jgi:hypothetical protein